MLNRNIAPPVKSIDRISLLPLQQVQFSNQFKVYYIHSSESEVLQLSLLFKAGYIHQQKKLLADAFASLITSGTLKHSSREIAEMLEYYGVFYSVEPSAVYTKLQFTFLKKNLFNVLPVIEEIIKYANFRQEEIDIYIKNQSEQYHTQIKNVNTLAQWQYSKLIYGNHHPLNKLHTPEDYQQITRDNLLYFFTAHIHPANGFAFVSGNIDANILHALESAFGKESFHQTEYQHSDKVPLPQSFEEHIYIQMPDALQSAIRMGMDIPLTQKDSDYFDFVIANTLLGGYFGSRLMTVIREEKGYTYGIYSALTVYDSFSVFTIASEIKAEHTQSAKEEIFRQIELLQNDEPNEEELQTVKNYLSGEILDNTDGILKQDNVWKIMLTKHLDKDYYNRFLERIKSIEPKDISKVMKKYLSCDRIKTCIVGKSE